MDCSLPGSSVHAIFQARILEQVVISFSGGSSQPGIEPRSPTLAGGLFTSWATSEASGVTIDDTWVGDEPLTSSSSRPIRPRPGNRIILP